MGSAIRNMESAVAAQKSSKRRSARAARQPGGGLTEELTARIARNTAAALERQRARLQGL